ncbi:MAG: STAS-like domain-containing protein [Proteobacteria bacterium]|nr:STAS-like domain-containing protein [Pseudomonadota bacterium]
MIISDKVYFSLTREDEFDWIFDDEEDTEKGTIISMELAKNSRANLKKVFDCFTSGGDAGFSKTVIPVSRAQYGDDKLVSRSQAKRVLVRIERFKYVLFDFENVESIGQAFADEIFRVFRNKNPNTHLEFVNANSQVQGMVERALQNKD